MNILTLFGLVAVVAMVTFYALEKKSHWYILWFSISCLAAAVYGFLQGAWPFGFAESIWSVIAFRRWWLARPRS